MSRLNTKIKNIKHDLILEKAAEMFETEGFDEMKISQLAKTVGVSVGTIYSYFDSKEGLYSAWVLKEIEMAYTMLQKLSEEELSSEAFIKHSIKIKFSMMAKKRNSLQSGILNNPFFFESQQILHKEALHKIYGLYIDIFDNIKEVDVESMQLVYILNALGNAYVMRWIEGEITDLEAKTDEVYTIFMKILKG